MIESHRDPPLVMLLGPTASGKSALAMALAEHLDLEIISIDSAQIYRHMDIGTAKPSAQDRAAVPHHLIDILEPEQSYSAARFADDARRHVHEIYERGRLPLLVGGTMLYARTLVDGLHALPEGDAALRNQLLKQAEQIGWPAMHARLADIDPPTAARLAPHDSQRIQRALEVHAITGRPLSALIAGPATNRWSGPVMRIALEPGNRALLHQRIRQRFDTMVADGLVDEVRALRARSELRIDLPAMRSVGYRQIWQWLDGGESTPLGEAVEAGVAATRQLAKRQLTWLRRWQDRIIYDSESPASSVQVADLIRAHTGR